LGHKNGGAKHIWSDRTKAQTLGSRFFAQKSGLLWRHPWVGADLSPTRRAAMHCRFDRKTKTHAPPSENCVYRMLKTELVLAFQQAVWAWQQARHGGRDGNVLLLNGKALRGSQGMQLVGAIHAPSGLALGVETVANKSNEIPADQMGRWELESPIALMDALHTQVQTAHTIVQEGGGDVVLVVKGDQPNRCVILPAH
jgi:hypothetical protein